MKGPLCFGLVAVLLLEVLGSVLAVDIPSYVMVGGSLNLRPKASSDHVNNILWKYNGNLVVEWVEDKVPVEFYSTFRNRSRLDTTNGRLEVDGMTKADSGIYSTEINNLVQSDRYDVKVIGALPVPDIKEKRTLTCNGVDFTDAEPITYSWKRDGQVIPDLSSPNLIINDKETRHVKTYSCLIKNPVSERESEAYDNPFFKEEKPHSGLITYVMVGGSLNLRPKASSDHVNNILWKYNRNLVVEWVEDKVPVEFYSTFRNRSRLDTTNGRLEVDGMTKADSGIYSTEINNLVQSDRYDVKVIGALSVPDIKEKRTLTCNGVDFTDAEPITYSWKRDGQVIPDLSSPNLIITNDEETRRVKTYSCLIKNPVSEKESEAYDNPFFKEFSYLERL